MNEVCTSIPDWHQPRNETCQQNEDCSKPCSCKRQRKRKQYRVCRVNDRTVDYNVCPNIVIEIHPNGLLVLRELRRSKRYETTCGKIYSGLLWKEAMRLAKIKKERRKK